jgi:hypothetical protein
MTSYNQAKQKFLTNNLSPTPTYVPKSIPDLEQLFLKQQLSLTDNPVVEDAWRDWLKGKGATGKTIADLWWSYLRSEGYTGHLRQMQLQYFIDEA